MIAQATKKSRKSADSDSESDGDNTVEWTKGLTTVQQMYISQEYKRNMGYESDDNVNHIEPDELSALKKKCKKQEKKLKKNSHWEVYATQRVGPKKRKVPRELSIGESNRRYADVCVMVKDPKTGKGKMLQALLDLGCTKSIILKKFTSRKLQTRINPMA